MIASYLVVLISYRPILFRQNNAYSNILHVSKGYAYPRFKISGQSNCSMLERLLLESRVQAKPVGADQGNKNSQWLTGTPEHLQFTELKNIMSWTSKTVFMGNNDESMGFFPTVQNSTRPTRFRRDSTRGLHPVPWTIAVRQSAFYISLGTKSAGIGLARTLLKGFHTCMTLVFLQRKCQSDYQYSILVSAIIPPLFILHRNK